MGAFDDAWAQADAAAEKESGVSGSRADRLDDSVADAAAEAAEAAYDRAADALGDTTSGSGAWAGDGDGGGGGGGGASQSGGGGGTATMKVENMMIPRSMGGRAFFSSVMVGYAGGLLVACGVNIATGTGQPALVYLVPATLAGYGSTVSTLSTHPTVERLHSFG